MKNNSRAFVNQLFIGLLVTLCFGGSVGLGTVWIRNQISITANTNRALAARIAELQRHIDEKEARIETEQNFEALRLRNEEWRLGLVPMSDSRLVIQPVAEDPVRLMVSRVNRGLFTDTAEDLLAPPRPRTAAAPGREMPMRVTFQAALGR